MRRFRMLARSRTAATAALASIILTACGAEASGNVSPGPGGPDAVSIIAADNTFEPRRLELTTGDEVEVEITNEGGTGHDFTVETLDLSTGPIEPGDVATATFTIPEGETMFACSVHGGMDGVIVGS